MLENVIAGTIIPEISFNNSAPNHLECNQVRIRTGYFHLNDAQTQTIVTIIIFLNKKLLVEDTQVSINPFFKCNHFSLQLSVVTNIKKEDVAAVTIDIKASPKNTDTSLIYLEHFEITHVGHSQSCKVCYSILKDNATCHVVNDNINDNSAFPLITQTSYPEYIRSNDKCFILGVFEDHCANAYGVMYRIQNETFLTYFRGYSANTKTSTIADIENIFEKYYLWLGFKHGHLHLFDVDYRSSKSYIEFKRQFQRK